MLYLVIWIGCVAGIILGLAGAIAASCLSIRNTRGPRERRFLIRFYAGIWLAAILLVVSMFMPPGPCKYLLWIFYALVLPLGIFFSMRTRRRIWPKDEAPDGRALPAGSPTNAAKTWMSCKIWLKLSTKIAFPLLVVWLSCAWYFHVWTWYDVQTCMMMSKECHPVWRPLFLRQIRVGQNLDKVIASTNPKRIERYGEFTRLSYQGGLAFTGVSIIARKDRLIQASAWSCTWTRVFFDKLSKADEEAFEIAYKAYVETILKKKNPEQKPSPPPTVSPPKTVSDSF